LHVCMYVCMYVCTPQHKARNEHTMKAVLVDATVAGLALNRGT